MITAAGRCEHLPGTDYGLWRTLTHDTRLHKEQFQVEAHRELILIAIVVS